MTVPDTVFGNTAMYAVAGCFVQRICHVYGRCPGIVESGLGCHRYRRIRHYAKVLITDPEQAYERYCHALRENLGLDNHFMAQNRRMISGQVEIQNYTIYNVTSDLVEIWQRDRDGTVSVWSGNVGNVHAPNGQLIEETGVYSEIAYPVEGFLGTRVMAHKGKTGRCYKK